jgi:hypothetical protein
VGSYSVEGTQTNGFATMSGTNASPANPVAQSAATLGATQSVITFMPVLGFVGAAPPVSYRVTDAYHQSTASTYTPTVLAATTTGPLPLTAGPELLEHVLVGIALVLLGAALAGSTRWRSPRR